uniref:SusD/RagB family nutrient-binding outer membrane lipoprotein n=1 Tax=Reichenbachiella sp. TaxID=2184521 RepID=UPI003B596550
ESSTTAFTLPVAEASIAVMMNLDLGIMTGFLNQYWTQAFQASQYQVYDNYTYNGNQTSTAWLHGYAWALEDLKFVRDQANKDGTPNYEAVAIILSAYTYQMLVDVWDDVPFSEALQGKEGNLNPSYDNGQDVYDGLIIMIDEALGLIDLSPSAINPGSEDFLAGGDMNLWIKFANTLKLRIYMRQALARPSVAQAGIQQLETDGALFLEAGEDIMVPFPGGSNNENPLYRGDVSTLGLAGLNINASNTMINFFNAQGDPRIDFYFDAPTTGPSIGTHVGINQGDGVTQTGGTPISDTSVPSSTNIVAPTSSVYFINGFESLFLQAEAQERGWLSGSAATTYAEAVQEAFTFAGMPASAPAFTGVGGNYEYPTGGSQAERLEMIAIQKWIGLCGINNVESWAESRRNNYFNNVTGAGSLLSFSQSSAGTGASLNGSQFPLRALYPVSEISTNPNATPNGNIGDGVWWIQ